MEVLIIVALLAIIIFLLFPAVGKMVEQGRTVRCLGALRSLGTVTHLYAADNDGYLFRMRAQDPVGPRDITKNPWSYPGGKLDPYWDGKRDVYNRLLGTELHQGCPNNRKQTGPAGSYTANRNVIIGAGDAARKLAGIQRPSQTLLVVEAGVNEWMNDGFLGTKPFYNLMGTHHQEKMNILWVDGHVTTAEKSSLLNASGSEIDSVWMGND